MERRNVPRSHRLLVLPIAVLAAAACARPLDLVAQESASVQSTQVVIVSAAGKLATSTPAGTVIPPTPTFSQDFSSILTPLALTPVGGTTPSPSAASPTPLLRPTRTPQPSVTPFPTLEIPPTPDRSQQAASGPPPTRTPAPPTATRPPPPTRPPTNTPSPTPPDPNGDISTLANALAIAPGQDVSGQLNGLKAVDVFGFDVTNGDDQIQVTLNGQDVEHYKIFLISPGRQQASAAQPLGANGRLIRYPARGETGTWYVEVTTDGKKVPTGEFTLRVDLRGADATATPTPKK